MAKNFLCTKSIKKFFFKIKIFLFRIQPLQLAAATTSVSSMGNIAGAGSVEPKAEIGGEAGEAGADETAKIEVCGRKITIKWERQR